MENIEKEAIRLIKSKLKEKECTMNTLASKMGVHQTTLTKMFHSDQIKLGRLKDISEILGFNFLRVLADQLDVNDPPKYTTEIASQQRISQLEIENAVLMKVLGK